MSTIINIICTTSSSPPRDQSKKILSSSGSMEDLGVLPFSEPYTSMDPSSLMMPSDRLSTINMLGTKRPTLSTSNLLLKLDFPILMVRLQHGMMISLLSLTLRQLESSLQCGVSSPADKLIFLVKAMLGFMCPPSSTSKFFS